MIFLTIHDLKNVTHVDTSSFSLKTNLASLKTEADKLDIDKLAPVPVNLSKLSDVVKMIKKAVVKKAAYEKLAAKVNNINIRAFVLKTKYQIDKTNILKLLQTKNIFNSLSIVLLHRLIILVTKQD